jgi:hypothetical protein
MKKLVDEFLEKFGTAIQSNETESHIELMMDSCQCITWYNKDYYVPENNMLYTTDDELIVEFLFECRGF